MPIDLDFLYFKDNTGNIYCLKRDDNKLKLLKVYKKEKDKLSFIGFKHNEKEVLNLHKVNNNISVSLKYTDEYTYDITGYVEAI